MARRRGKGAEKAQTDSKQSGRNSAHRSSKVNTLQGRGADQVDSNPSAPCRVTVQPTIIPSYKGDVKRNAEFFDHKLHTNELSDLHIDYEL